MRHGGWAAALAYGGTLGLREFFHDDQAIIAGNRLLQEGWRGLWGLWTTGYWEAAQGSAAAVHYYRPVLMLSFWLQTMTTGLWAPAMHGVNIGLHVLAVLLLRSILLRRLPVLAAEAAAIFYAISPMHSEAVAFLTGRSELLAAVFVFGAWLCLDSGSAPGRRGPGVALFILGLLSKETVFLFPALLALSDWVFHRRTPWQRERRQVHALLAAGTCAVLAARWAVLPELVAGGLPYFSSRLTAALTFPGFAWAHYLWPSLTGLGQCSDYSRPLIPDAGLSSASAWLSLAAMAALMGGGLWSAVRRRSPAGFWIAGPAFFLLPGSHLILPLDSIGAERFLYLPLMGLCVGVGSAYAWLAGRARRAAKVLGFCLAAWFLALSVERNRIYRSGESFYRAAVSCNPLSARAWSSLGAALLLKGENEAGVMHLRRAIALDPGLGTPHYNLARLAFAQGRLTEAQEEVERAIKNAPGDVEAMVLSALVAERRGDLAGMRRRLEEALAVLPGHALARYNLGRYWLLAGRRDRADAFLTPPQ
jgi:tetratricopeptide (TPR) repeat protein